MCIIIAKPRGVESPSLDTLRMCNTNNGDGCGLAYHIKGGDEVYIKKDFNTVDEMFDFMCGNITTNDSAVIHFRLATSGLVDFGNRHPFPLSDKDELLRSPELTTNMALAHNGVFHKWNGKSEILSDTQMFIKDILSDPIIHNNLSKSIALQKLLSDYVNGNKLAIIDSKGNLMIWGHFEKDEGLLYSNTSYKQPKLTYANQLAWSGSNMGAWGQCYCCENKGTDYIIFEDEEWIVCDVCKDLLSNYIREECI